MSGLISPPTLSGEIGKFIHNQFYLLLINIVCMSLNISERSKALLDFLLDDLLAKKECEIFREPVPFLELGLNDYVNVVKHPVDLNQIKSNLHRNAYSSKESCLADIRQIFHNAKIYNAVGSPIYNIASDMSAYFEQLCHSMDTEERSPSLEDLSKWIEACRRYCGGNF